MRISDWSSDVCSSDLVRLLPSRGEASNAIVIPDEALQTLEGRDVVLVRTKQGFRARNVTLGQRTAGRVEISSGLKPGDMIATKNAFLLKAAQIGRAPRRERVCPYWYSLVVCVAVNHKTQPSPT